MLGVATYDEDDPADDFLREYAEEIGVAGTYAKTRVGVFLGEAGETVPDPFFGGEGPDRTGCLRCGRCMVGCPHGAKNTLVKNYLWFAERAGAKVMPERTVVDIKPLGAPTARTATRSPPSAPARGSGATGARQTAKRRGRRRRRAGHQPAARRVPAQRLAAEDLAAPGRARAHELGGDPRRHAARGRARRHAPGGDHRLDLPEPDTHIETVVYGEAGDGVSGLFTLLVGDGTPLTRPLKLAGGGRHATRSCSATDAQPARLVEAHDHRARHAVARQRDRAARPPGARRARAAEHRAGPGAPEPDLHPGRQRVRGMARPAHGRDRAELDHGGRGQHPAHRAHPRRRRDRRRPGERASSTPASACSATRTCWSATGLRSRPTWASTRASRSPLWPSTR